MSDSTEFLSKTCKDVEAWMDEFYVDGSKADFRLHCQWAWKEQERRHRAVEAELLAELNDMCAEFRGHDLHYGSAAYAKAISVINKARGQQ